MSKTVREHPNCKIILSHAGGTLPYLATRAAVTLPDYGLSDQSSADFMQDAKSLYYDLALSGNDYTLGLLTKFAKTEHILFGSDFPYAPTPTIRTHTSNLDLYNLRGEERWKINRGNALKLFKARYSGTRFCSFVNFLSIKQTKDTGAEIDVVEVVDETYRIHVALWTANDHVSQAVLGYILFPALYRSLCCTGSPLVAARHQLGTQLHDLRCCRLPAS